MVRIRIRTLQFGFGFLKIIRINSDSDSHHWNISTIFYFQVLWILHPGSRMYSTKFTRIYWKFLRNFVFFYISSLFPQKVVSVTKSTKLRVSDLKQILNRSTDLKILRMPEIKFSIPDTGSQNRLHPVSQKHWLRSAPSRIAVDQLPLG